jgi:TM2 domain-containing membrane protein YozV
LDEDQFCDGCGSPIGEKGIPVIQKPYVPPPPQPAQPQTYAPPPSYTPPPPQPAQPYTPGTPLPAQPGPVRHKSAGLAALGSFFFSGLGQVYNGRPGKGVVIFIGTIVGILVFVVPGIIIWIYGVVDAYLTAKKMNEGKIPFQEHNWFQIITFFIFSFIVGYSLYSLLMMIAGTMIEEGYFLT